jgi:hypothetical protein
VLNDPRTLWSRLLPGPALGEKPGTPRATLAPPGPGTHLARILTEVGIHEPGCCGCGGLAASMDAWGPAGCREPANEATILAQLRENYDKLGWGTVIRAGYRALRSKLAFRLNPRDPAPGLLAEAIRRAEAGPA